MSAVCSRTDVSPIFLWPDHGAHATQDVRDEYGIESPEWAASSPDLSLFGAK